MNTGNVMRVFETKLSTHYESQWKEKLQAEFAVRGEQHDRNKLRTYYISHRGHNCIFR